MGFAGCIPRFLKAHGGWVLTALGLLGFGGTVILTAKAAPVVQQEIEEDFQLRIDETLARDPITDGGQVDDEWLEAHYDDIHQTFWDKCKIALPHYLPAIFAGTASAGCIFGAQIFNVRRQAALISSIAALTTQFDQYREAIRAECGDDTDKRALEISRMRIEEMKDEIRRLKEENGPYLYGITTLPGIIFEAKPADIQEALLHFGRNMVLRGDATLSELYGFIGIPEDCYDQQLADDFGFNEYINETAYMLNYVDFGVKSIFTQSGRPVNMITPAVPPYRINNVDSDRYWDDGDFESYPDYAEVEAKAFKLAENIRTSDNSCCHDQLTKIHHPHIAPGNLYLDLID